MGFWESAGKAATGTAKALGNAVEEENRVRQELETKSDDELIRIYESSGFFGSSPREKRWAKAILGKRGVNVS